MSKLFWLFIGLGFICISCQQEQAVPIDDPRSGWFYQQRAFPYDDINMDSYLKAIKQRNQKQSEQKGNTAFEEPWTLIGPSNVGGRITDIEMWPDDPFTILAGSASGGIFKSEDQGQSWEAIFDDAASLAIGDIEISDSNPDVIYVGTGEANSGGGSIAYDGIGVFISEDRGETWNHLGLENIGSIGKVAVDAKNEDRVFVAAMGRLFRKNDERGLYRTLDGGDNWEQVLFVSDSTGCIDLAMHPDNPDTLFAAMWERTRRPNDIIYGGTTTGLYRSYDGGDNWTRLNDMVPFDNVENGRMAVEIAPSDPNVVYVYLTKKNGQSEAMYRSDDLGNTWTKKSLEGVDNVPYQWWFSKLSINPNDADDLYLASFNMFRSTDGASNWNPVFVGVHVDQHALFVHPQNDQLTINGNDGGVYVSQNAGATNEKSVNLPNIQFYNCEIDPNNTSIVYGGAQDNGTWRNFSDDPNGWESLFGGDGFRVMVEPEDGDTYYLGYQNGNIFRTTNNGITYEFIMGSIDSDDRKNWNTPMTLDYNNPSTIYVGTQRVWRSFNRGTSFEAISPDLTNGPYEGNRTFGTIVALESSRINSSIIYAGTDDGNVWNSEDGGSSWTDVTPGMSVPRWTTGVVPDPIDDDVAYVTFSGFRYGTDDGHVYRTEDRGETWTDITGDLPDIPVNDLQVDLRDNSRLYLATDVGVFYSLDYGNTWEVLGDELPNVPVNDIDIESDGKLVAATFGRSMYYYLTPDVSSTIDLYDFAWEVFPNPSSDIIQFRLNEKCNNCSVDLYNIHGQKVLSQEDLNAPLHISHLPKGSYLLKLQSKDSRILANEKIMIQ